MNNNSNRLKNAITQNWLRGNTNVYRIYNPNHTNSKLVNKNSLFKYIESNRVKTLKRLDELVTRVNATLGEVNRYAEVPYGAGRRIPNLLYRNSVNGPKMNNYMKKTHSLNNYVFTKYNEHRGRVTVRNPIYGVNLKLKNIEPNKLTVANKREARKRKRNENKNMAAQRENVMRRVRENAAVRERARRQQNARAGPPDFMWYLPRAGRFWFPPGRIMRLHNVGPVTNLSNLYPGPPHIYPEGFGRYDKVQIVNMSHEFLTMRTQLMRRLYFQLEPMVLYIRHQT